MLSAGHYEFDGVNEAQVFMAVQCDWGFSYYWTIVDSVSTVAEDQTEVPWVCFVLGFGACHEWRDVSGWMEKGSFVTERQKENSECLE